MEAEKLKAAAMGEPANDKPARDLVRLRVPPGIGAVTTLSGRRVDVSPDGAIEVSVEDAVSFERQGWQRIEATA